MSTELVVALIASGSSLLVAIVGLITSIISNRQSARSEKAIESLRFEFSQAASRDAISDENLKGALTALSLAIQAIQNFKDEIQLILAAVDSSLPSKTAVERLLVAREELFTRYKEQMVHLSKEEEKAFHRAKNMSLAVESFVKESLREEGNASSLSEHSRQRLIFLRHELTEMQDLLRDSKTDRFLRRTSNEP